MRILALLAILGLTVQNRTFVIEADDLRRFDVTDIVVKRGETVTVKLKNTGRLRNHGHNFVLLAQGADVNAFSQSAQPGVIEPALKNQVIASTELASPGQTVSTTFKAPAPGSYVYICSYPGHQSKSRGTLRVQ